MAEDHGDADSKKRLSVQAGDVVAYSRQFLRNTGQYTGDAPFARGKVTNLTALGSILLASIDWNCDTLPGKVNVANLSLVRDGVVMEVD